MSIDKSLTEYRPLLTAAEGVSEDRAADQSALIRQVQLRDAEIEALRAEAVNQRAASAEELLRQIAKTEATEARAARLEADAARYQWLRTRDVRFETDDGMESVSYIPELGHDGSNLDACIDAARSAVSGGGGE